MKIFNKVLALFLAVITVLSMVPFAAIAETWIDVDASKNGDSSKVTVTLDASELLRQLKEGGLSASALKDLILSSTSVDKEALLEALSPSDILDIIPSGELVELIDFDSLASYLTLDLFYDSVFDLVDVADYVPAYVTYDEIWDYCDFSKIDPEKVITEGVIEDLLAADVDPFGYCEDGFDVTDCLYLTDFLKNEAVEKILVDGLTNDDPDYEPLKDMIPSVVSITVLAHEGVVTYDEIWSHTDFDGVDVKSLVTDAMIEDLKAADVDLFDFVNMDLFYAGLELDRLANDTTVKDALVAGLTDKSNADYNALRDALPAIFDAEGAVNGGAFDFDAVFDSCDFTAFDTALMNEEIVYDLLDAGVDLAAFFANPADPTTVNMPLLVADATARGVMANGLTNDLPAYLPLKNALHNYIDEDSAIDSGAITYSDAMAYCDFTAVNPSAVINDGILDDLLAADVDPFDFCDEDYDILAAFDTEAFIADKAVEDVLVAGVEGLHPKYPDLKQVLLDVVDFRALLDDNTHIFEDVIPYCDFSEVQPALVVTDGIIEDMKEADINLLDFVNTSVFFDALDLVAFAKDPAVSSTLISGMSGNNPDYAELKKAWPDVVSFDELLSDGVITPSDIIAIETLEALLPHLKVELLVRRVISGEIPVNSDTFSATALKRIVVILTEQIDRIEIDGTTVATEDMFGTLSVDIEALAVVLAKIVPLLEDIAEMENNVVISTNIKVDYTVKKGNNKEKKSKDVTFELVLDDNLDLVKKFAGKISALINRYLIINMGADAMDVQLNLPTVFADVYMKALNFDKISDSIKLKLMNLSNKEGNETVGFLSDLTLGEILDLFDSVEASKLYNGLTNISYVNTALEKVGAELGVDLTEFDVNDLKDYITELPSFERICEVAEKKLGRDVAAIVENAAEKFDATADRITKINYVEKMLNLIGDKLGYDLSSITAAEILDRVDEKPISETIAQVVADKIGVDILAKLQNSTVDQLYAAAIDHANAAKAAYEIVRDKLIAVTNFMPDAFLKTTLMELYRGEGYLSTPEKEVAVETQRVGRKLLNNLTSRLGITVPEELLDFASSYFTNTKISYGFSASVHVGNMFKITYAEKPQNASTYSMRSAAAPTKELFSAFVPKGTDLSVFSKQPAVAGYNIVGWADADGNPVRYMPGRDLVVYADYVPVEYTVTLKNNVDEDVIGSFTYNVETTKEEFMAKLNAVVPPVKAGYEFLEWDFDYDTDFVGMGDMTITAIYAPEEEVFTVTVKDSVFGETIGSFNYWINTTKDSFMAKLNAIEPIEIDGYRYVGHDFDYDRYFLNNPPSDITIVYLYEKIELTYKVTLMDSVDETEIGYFYYTANTTKTQFMNLLGAVQLPEHDGYVFDHWDFDYDTYFWNNPVGDFEIWAVYVPVEAIYTVTLRDNIDPSIVIGSFTYTAGTTKAQFMERLNAVQVPEKSGYVFGGWDFDYDIYFANHAVGDFTIYARYIPEDEAFKVTVKADIDEEILGEFYYTATTDERTFMQLLNAVNIPEKLGYQFTGFDFDYKTYFATHEHGDFTIYALYVVEADAFEVTLKEKVNNTVIDKFYYSINTTKTQFMNLLNAVQVPVIGGYVFVGWDFDYDTYFFNHTFGDMTIYALYAEEEQAFKVTLKDNIDGTTVLGEFYYTASTTKVVFMNMLNAVLIPEKNGYRNGGWDFDYDLYFANHAPSDFTIYTKYILIEDAFQVTIVDSINNEYAGSFYYDAETSKREFLAKLEEARTNLPVFSGYVFMEFLFDYDEFFAENDPQDIVIVARYEFLEDAFKVTLMDNIDQTKKIGEFYYDLTTTKTQFMNRLYAVQVPEKAGYVFIAWDFDYDAYFAEHAPSDMTIWSIYEVVENAFKVTLKERINNTVIGSFHYSANTTKVQFMDRLDSILPPAIEGYTFIEWDFDYDTYFATNGLGDFDIYAIYEIDGNAFRVTLKYRLPDDTEGAIGSFNYSVATTKQEFMDRLNAVGCPVIRGYTLLGWDFDYDTAFANGPSDLTIYALYEYDENAYRVSVYYRLPYPANESGYVGEFRYGLSTTKTEFYNLLGSVNLPEHYGFEFDSWDFDFDEFFANNDAQDLVIYADYRLKEGMLMVTLRVKSDDGRYNNTQIGYFLYDIGTTKDEFMERLDALKASVPSYVEQNYVGIGFADYTLFDYDTYFTEDRQKESFTLYALYTRKTYPVTFLDEEGNEISSVTVKHGYRPVFVGTLPTKGADDRSHVYTLYWTKAGKKVDLNYEVVTAPVTYQAAFLKDYHFGFNVPMDFDVVETDGLYRVSVKNDMPEHYRFDVSIENLLRHAFEEWMKKQRGDASYEDVRLEMVFYDETGTIELEHIIIDHATLTGFYKMALARKLYDPIYKVEIDSTVPEGVLDGFKDTIYDETNAIFHTYGIIFNGDEENHSDFNGTFNVKLAFDEAAVNRPGVKTFVYVVDRDGTLRLCRNIATSNGYVSFDAPHFSEFAIVNKYFLDVEFVNGVEFDDTVIAGTLENAGDMENLDHYYAFGEVVNVTLAAQQLLSTIDAKTLRLSILNDNYDIESILAYSTLAGDTEPTLIADLMTESLVFNTKQPITVRVTVTQTVYNIYYYAEVDGVLQQIGVDSYTLATLGDVALRDFPTDFVAPLGYTGEGRWVGYDEELRCVSDMYVYAAWDLITYTVVFKEGESEIRIDFNVENYGSVVAPAVPEKVGYIGAWEAYDLAAVINGTDTENVDGTTKTVYAEYTPCTYQVFIEGGTTQTHAMGETVTLTPGKLTGYVLGFKAYNMNTGLEIELVDNTFTMPAANVNVVVVKTVAIFGYTVEGVEGEAEYGSVVTFPITVPAGKYISEISKDCTFVSAVTEEDGSRTYIYSFVLTKDGQKITYKLADIPYVVNKILNGSLYTEVTDPVASAKDVVFAGWSGVVANVFRFATFTLEDASSLLWLWILIGVAVFLLLIALIYILHIRGKIKTSFLTRFAVWVVGLFFGICTLIAKAGLWLVGLFGKTEEDFTVEDEELPEKSKKASKAEEAPVAEESVREVVENPAEESIDDIADTVIAGVMQAANEEATEEVTEEVAEEATEEVTEEVTEEATEEVTEEATEEVTEEATEDEDPDKQA